MDGCICQANHLQGGQARTQIHLHLNGDGIDDVIVGGYGANANAGVAYVVYGNTTGGNITLSSGSIASSQGFKISGDAAAWFGNSVSNAGDLNGDGLSDLVIGAPAANSSAGAYHIILGGTQTVTSAVNGTGTSAACSCSPPFFPVAPSPSFSGERA